MKEKNIKTNAMRILDSNKIEYNSFTYETDGTLTGLDVANLLGQNPSRVFKTLVTVGHSKNYYVFVVPVNKELNLKKASISVKEKNIEMLKQKELFKLTGYVHGGCSPIGMKKLFTTIFDKTALDYEKVIFSAGKIGAQVEVCLKDIESIVHQNYASITD